MNDQKTTSLTATGWREPLAFEATGPSSHLPIQLILLQVSEVALAAVSTPRL